MIGNVRSGIMAKHFTLDSLWILNQCPPAMRTYMQPENGLIRHLHLKPRTYTVCLRIGARAAGHLR